MHGEENNKGFRDVIDHKDDQWRKDVQTPVDMAYEEMEKLNFPHEKDDEEFIEQRVFMKQKKEIFRYSDEMKMTDEPYEQDLRHFPDCTLPYPLLTIQP